MTVSRWIRREGFDVVCRAAFADSGAGAVSATAAGRSAPGARVIFQAPNAAAAMTSAAEATPMTTERVRLDDGVGAARRRSNARTSGASESSARASASAWAFRWC